jgi:hypothetical protein
MPFIEDLGKLFLDAGLVTAKGTDLFLSTRARIPDGPGPYTSLIETGGLGPLRTHNRPTTIAYERPGAQIVVRCSNYVTARDLCRNLYFAVATVKNQFLNTVWYREIKITQVPFDAGSDQQNRATVIFNVIGDKRP